MKYNLIKTALLYSHNNSSIKQLVDICKKYDYITAKKIINSCKDIIEAYIRLSKAERTPEIVVMMEVTKEIIFTEVLCQYTQPEAIFSHSEEETEIIRSTLSEVENLPEIDRENLREQLQDLTTFPVYIMPGMDFARSLKEFKESRAKEREMNEKLKALEDSIFNDER